MVLRLLSFAQHIRNNNSLVICWFFNILFFFLPFFSLCAGSILFRKINHKKLTICLCLRIKISEDYPFYDDNDDVTCYTLDFLFIHHPLTLVVMQLQCHLHRSMHLSNVPRRNCCNLIDLKLLFLNPIRFWIILVLKCALDAQKEYSSFFHSCWQNDGIIMLLRNPNKKLRKNISVEKNEKDKVLYFSVCHLKFIRMKL